MHQVIQSHLMLRKPLNLNYHIIFDTVNSLIYMQNIKLQGGTSKNITLRPEGGIFFFEAPSLQVYILHIDL